MLKKLTLLMLLTVLLASCSAQKTNEQLVVGMECNSAPFNWIEPDESEGSIFVESTNGYCKGYDVTVAKEIASKLGRELVVKAIVWEGLIPALNADQIDLIIAGMSYTADRAKEVNFSEPYYFSDYVMIVPKDSPYLNAKSIQDFSGAELVGQMSTNYDIIIDQIDGVVHQPALSTIPLIVNAIESGASDGSPIEKPIGQSIVATNPNLVLVEFEEGQGFVQTQEITTEVSIAVKKDNDELLKQINDYLTTVSQEQRNAWMTQALNDSSGQ